ncbi:MAG: MurR/RpiR family transcriptional regulator [Liquorilactobacillus nagelii]|jgi:DNA-binding MurR/RpiR family transcriptional regulator|uniref:MurR/RpiR family transcriptional regulator n=1 Tax=Liquorilactobacillus nagelii TaxID=82688 RepID=UPI0039E7F7D9
MSVKGKILNAMPNLSRSEKKIGNYILENSAHVVQMTVAQLAQEAGSSPATVIRLVRDLKIESFTTLKIELSANLSKENGDEKTYEDIKSNEELDTIKNKLLSNAQHSIQETVEQIDGQEVKNLVDMISQSKQLILYGVGASSLVAENISQKWSRLGYSTDSDSSLNLLLPKLSNASVHSLVWIISNSGSSPEALIAAEQAKKHSLKVASLTRFGTNPLVKYSDFAIHTSQPQESENRIAATSSLSAQFIAVDIIFYYFVSQNFENSVQLLNKSHKVIEEYRQNFK